MAYPWETFDPATSGIPGVTQAGPPMTPASAEFVRAAQAAQEAQQQARLAQALPGTPVWMREEREPAVTPQAAPAGPFNPAAGRGTVSIGAPGSLPQLAGLGGEPGTGPDPVNPFAGFTPEQLMRPVPVGGTSSSTTQITPGVPMMPGLSEGLSKASQAQAQAIDAEARAKSKEAQERSYAMQLHQSNVEARQAHAEKERAKQLAKIEEWDAEYSKERQAVAEMKVDPDRFWKTRHPIQIIALMIGSAFQELAKGLAGQPGGPNQVLEMVNETINRDIDSQKADIANKRAGLAEQRGVLGDLYRKLGDMDQAESQARIMLNEGLQMRLAGLEQTSQSEVVRSRAAGARALLDQNLLQLKNQAWQAAQPRVTKSISGTTQRAPLAQVLLAQHAQMQKAQAAGQPKPLEAPKPAERKEWQAIQEMRRGLVHFLHEYKRLGLPSGVTAFAGEAGDRVEKLRDRLMDKLVKVEVGAGASAEYLKAFKGSLSRSFSGDEDVRKRIGMIMHEMDDKETAWFEAHSPYTDVRPLALRSIENQRLADVALGGGGAK